MKREESIIKLFLKEEMEEVNNMLKIRDRKIRDHNIKDGIHLLKQTTH